ncbi:MAG TPA: FAD-dependent oxidoreductase [Vicinamibacterales bacterium]|jgi:glycine/D-amino acid oxidase-like deaminating enzyme|nr:FAD-dependent oxidoreductase [Vicinamibacterales bacterium]
MKVTRRGFLESTGATAGLAILGCRKTERPIAGGFVNESEALGHRLRDHDRFALPTRIERRRVVVVGGGIAGLSAAWRLRKTGFTEFIVLEMEAEPGGTSRSGRNAISEFPWAAHYVPVPNRNAKVERELFTELGLILPDGRWNPAYLCRAPEERIFIDGTWHEGLHIEGLAHYSPEEFERFLDAIARFRDSEIFTIPIALGSSLADLDLLSMADWMRQQNFTSRHLLWYVDYACRDDYGSSMEDVSAWTGIHYFACRDDEQDRVFTWPEGNGWIVKRLMERVGDHVRAGAPVFRIRREGWRVQVFTEDVLYDADAVIFAAPTFLAPYLIEGMPPLDRRVWQYSPWLTANLVVDRPPKSLGRVAWDNVCFDSPALGYVVANHQSGRVDGPMVWTFYWALAAGRPSENRQRLATRDWNRWKDAVLSDLEIAHPDIRQCVSRIDMMRMGHAMPRPVVGSIFDGERKRIADQKGPILFAHTDLSGFAIFEEAQHRGVLAADRALAWLGGTSAD